MNYPSSNRYPGNCCSCGKHVAMHKGLYYLGRLYCTEHCPPVKKYERPRRRVVYFDKLGSLPKDPKP